MNTFWCYKVYLIRSSEHLYFLLTALYLLLVCFHFKNESTDLINWYTCLFSPLFTLRHVICLTTLYKDISQNVHVDVVLSVFIHPCSQKRRRAQFSIRAVVASICVRTLQMCVCVCVRFRCVCARTLQTCVCAYASDVCVCVRFRCASACFRCMSVCVRFRCVCVCALDVCAGNFSQLATVPPTIPSVLYARLVHSGSAYIESWHGRLKENTRVGGNA